MRLRRGDTRRIDARDRKLQFREEIIADRTGCLKRRCPCNICLGENRSLRFRSIVRDHLKRYGRHPFHRGRTEVCIGNLNPLLNRVKGFQYEREEKSANSDPEEELVCMKVNGHRLKFKGTDFFVLKPSYLALNEIQYILVVRKHRFCRLHNVV